jgi:hypothetical protein
VPSERAPEDGVPLRAAPLVSGRDVSPGVSAGRYGRVVVSASVAPLVGRDGELRVFERVLEAVDAGGARAVGVVG